MGQRPIFSSKKVYRKNFVCICCLKLAGDRAVVINVAKYATGTTR